MRPQLRLLYVLLLFITRVVHISTQCTIGYTGPDSSLWCTCNAGYTGRNVFAPYSTTVCTRFFGLTKNPSFESVATRNNVAIGSVILPTYNPLGGPNGNGHFSFDRTKSQWLNAGSRTLNIATNGGFTFVAVVRLTALPGNFERIIDLGSGPNSNTIIVCRSGTSNILYVKFWNGPTAVNEFRSQPILVQNVWLTITVTYLASTRFYQVNGNGNILNNVATALTDRTVSVTSLGKSQGVSNDFLTADVAGCFVVDEYLGIDATTEIAKAMSNGVDLTNTTCPSGSSCTACAAGTYKSGTGSTECIKCPAGSTSPASSTSSAACIVAACNAGYTGPHGGVCTACAAGTYKVGTGSAVCTSCPAFSGVVCAPCTLSTLCVCTDYTGEACTACVSASAPASTNASTCVCGPGQYDASAQL